MNFTAEERRLIESYRSAFRQDTISALWDALPSIENDELLASAWSAIGKLDSISDLEFSELFEGVADHAS